MARIITKNVDVDVDIEPQEVLDELTDEDLIQECVKRGMAFRRSEEKELSLKEIYVLLCDRYAKNHLTKWDDVILELKKEIDNQ